MKTNSLFFLFIMCIFCLYSQSGYANKNWEIILITKNHIGYADNKTLFYKDKKLVFTGMSIDRLLYPSALQKIDKIKNHKSKKNYCHKGEYFLKINKFVKTSGCLESEDYVSLNENFNKLKYLAFISSNLNEFPE